MKKEYNLFLLLASQDVCLDESISEYKCAKVKCRMQDQTSRFLLTQFTQRSQHKVNADLCTCSPLMDLITTSSKHMFPSVAPSVSHYLRAKANSFPLVRCSKNTTIIVMKSVICSSLPLKQETIYLLLQQKV